MVVRLNSYPNRRPISLICQNKKARVAGPWLGFRAKHGTGRPWPKNPLFACIYRFLQAKNERTGGSGAQSARAS